MLTRSTTPLLFAIIFKHPCFRSLRLNRPSIAIKFNDIRDYNYVDTFRQGPGRCKSSLTSSAVLDVPSFTNMGRKRPWAKKKEERSRSFAKRGRVGGWGDYGPDGAGQPKGSRGEGDLSVSATAVDGAALAGKPSCTAEQQHQKQEQAQKKQSRKVYDVHPGSYAGDLAEILSEERRRVLSERLEQDVKREQTGKAASTEDPGCVEEGGAAPDISKKKVALLISYWGSNYQGLQINEGARTVEAELELALYLAGVVSKDNFGNLRKVSWTRSGRTDKGVHAAAQLISLKMTYPNDGERATVKEINRHLPEDIRVVDIKRAPKSFDARIRCTGRRYEYIMPTFVLARKEHVLGLFDEAIASKICQGVNEDVSEVGELSSGIGGSSAVPVKGSRSQLEASTAPMLSRKIETKEKVMGVVDVPHVQAADDGDDHSDWSEGGEGVMDEVTGKADSVELSSPVVVQWVAEQLQGYRLSAEEIQVLRNTLKVFVGTRNYHNYTNHKKPTDPSCKRLITSFTAGDPFEENGMEWIKLTVEGQSFIMHQIRKMVAATVDRVRGQSSQDDLMRTFDLEKTNLGIAPSEGLYLERPLYTIHNKHMKQQGAQDRALEWESGDAADAIEDFKRNKIHPGILAKEKADHEFVAWLDRLTRYPCNY